MKKREFADYLQDIYDSIVDLEEFVDKMTLRDFKGDKKTIYAAIRCFEVIGEATKKFLAFSEINIQMFHGARWRACGTS